MDIVEQVVGMIYRMFDIKEYGGPMFEKYFRLIVRTLLEGNEPLIHFNKIAIDKKFRNSVLTRIGESRGYDVYKDLDQQFDDADEYKSEGSGMWHYITSKMVRFCDNDILKSFVTNDKINLDFKQLMDQKAIVIVRMAAGVVPETITNIIGMIINMRLNIAAKERVRIPLAKRNPYFLVIDEFQNFVSANANFSHNNAEERDLTSILSEARKYGLGLILANQYISQLDRGAREAVFGNVGGKIAFRVGVEDAKYLAATFSRGIQIGDFVDLPNFHGYASLLMNNMYIDPITVKTIP